MKKRKEWTIYFILYYPYIILLLDLSYIMQSYLVLIDLLNRFLLSSSVAVYEITTSLMLLIEAYKGSATCYSANDQVYFLSPDVYDLLFFDFFDFFGFFEFFRHDCAFPLITNVVTPV